VSTKRLTKDELLHALASFATLAAAYTEATEEQIAADPKLQAALRSAEAILTEHLQQRVTEHDARAVTAVGTMLRSVYARVLANATGESSHDGPSSRRTWHEGAWYTDEQRRAVLERVFGRWLPGLTPEGVAGADLSAAQISERGGAASAATEMATHLASAVKRAGAIASVASTLPYDDDTSRPALERVRAFIDEALAYGTRS